MSERLPGLPAPVLNPTNEGYWLRAAEGLFVIQRCASCGTHRHPPTEVCYACHSQEWQWDEGLPGTGRVFSYTWVYRPNSSALAPIVPYNVSIVEVDGTAGVVRVCANVFEVDDVRLQVGLPVRVVFDRCGSNVSLPAFVPHDT